MDHYSWSATGLTGSTASSAGTLVGTDQRQEAQTHQNQLLHLHTHTHSGRCEPVIVWNLPSQSQPQTSQLLQLLCHHDIAVATHHVFPQHLSFVTS